MRRLGSSIALLVLAAAPLHGQSFDAPSFQTPFRESGFGAYAFSPTADDVGGMAILRRSGEKVDLGLRFGLLDRTTDERYFAGVEVKRGAARGDARGSEAAMVTGFGVGWIPDHDRIRLRFPLGFTWGVRHEAGSVAYVPYVHPRALFDLDFEQAPAGGVDEEDWDSDLDLGFDVDLGFDIEIRRAVAVRFAATLGTDDVVGVGLALRSF